VFGDVGSLDRQQRAPLLHPIERSKRKAEPGAGVTQGFHRAHHLRELGPCVSVALELAAQPGALELDPLPLDDEAIDFLQVRVCACDFTFGGSA
jgi:hypothetical protein